MGRIGSVSLVCSVLLLARLGLARVGQDRDGVTLGVTGEVHHNAGEGVSDSGSEGGHGHHHNHDHDQEEVRVTKQVEEYNDKKKHKHHHEKEEEHHHKEQRGEEDHPPTKHDHKGGKNHQHEEHSQEKVKHKDQSHAEPDQEEEQDLSNTLAGIHSSVWLASLGSITVISLVGLVAVAALPLLRGENQQAVLQVLVSLAVGTLVGDSLIHLIPHAFGAEHGDTSVVWKGFTATLTIVAFFVLDRSMAAMGHGHSHGGPHKHSHDLEGSTSDTRTTRESTPDIKDIRPILRDAKVPKISVASKESSDSGVGAGSSSGAGSLYSLYRHSYHSLARAEAGPALQQGGHSRACCAMPSSSLMVIVGDAVHNFADGLAVGAAFSLSLAAGFSTSVAVLCHELPHEVGDFALLLSQGMSAKTAIFYNVVSSVFAGLGLLVGLLLGSHEGLSSWLLSATVGVFLYVALVSMMTELKGGGFQGLLLNTAGMLAGAVLLLAIGLYEHDLILLFESDPLPHKH